MKATHLAEAAHSVWSPCVKTARALGFVRGLMQPEAAGIATAWPAPPRYYLEPRRPPPPPVEGPHTMYGVQRPAFGTLPPTPPLERPQYDANADPCTELRELNRVMLRSFLSLLDTMQTAPTQCAAKGAPPRPRSAPAHASDAAPPRRCAVEDIKWLMLNVQHLVNTFRPYQAREELIAALQAQVDEKRALVDALRSECERCEAREAAGELSAADGDEGRTEGDEALETLKIDSEADTIAASIAADEAREELTKALGKRQR
jgi:hypothetical protein